VNQQTLFTFGDVDEPLPEQELLGQYMTPRWAAQLLFAGISGTYNFRVGDRRGLGVGDVLVARWDPAKSVWTAVSKFGG
jgi:hypothetical protein